MTEVPTVQTLDELALRHGVAGQHPLRRQASSTSTWPLTPETVWRAMLTRAGARGGQATRAQVPVLPARPDRVITGANREVGMGAYSAV